jgi:hypothetical protein
MYSDEDDMYDEEGSDLLMNHETGSIPIDENSVRVAPPAEAEPTTEVCRKFNWNDQQNAKPRKRCLRSGRVVPIYWPALLLTASQRVGWSPSQRRLLLAIVRELTRTRVRGDSNAEIVRNGRVPTGFLGRESILCPLLDQTKEFIVFGGNKRWRGHGYHLLGRTYGGWFSRAGYDKEEVTLPNVKKLFCDLGHLARDLGLVFAGYNSRRRSWYSLENSMQMLQKGRDRELLAGATFRIYAPADWQLHWRRFFSQQLGFDWIPRYAGDDGLG